MPQASAPTQPHSEWRFAGLFALSALILGMINAGIGGQLNPAFRPAAIVGAIIGSSLLVATIPWAIGTVVLAIFKVNGVFHVDGRWRYGFFALWFGAIPGLLFLHYLRQMVPR